VNRKAAAPAPLREACWIVLNDLHTPVIATQVLAPLRAYGRLLPEVRFRLLFVDAARRALSLRGMAAARRWRAAWRDGRVQVAPYIGRLGEGTRDRTVRARLRDARAPLVLHGRGPGPSLMFRDLANRLGARLVFDARGASGEEAALRTEEAGGDPRSPEGRRSAERCAAQDRGAWENADAVTAVTARLFDHLRGPALAGTKPEVVIPPCVETVERDHAAGAERRRTLGVGEREALVVHMSTSPQWEDFGRVFRMFRSMSERRDARLLLLTTVAEERVLRSLDGADPLRRRLILRAVPSAEVRSHLAAADVGLLVRRHHPAFAATVPAKFVEYLAAGLPVAVADDGGEAADLVRREGAGIVLEDDDAAAGESLVALAADATAAGARALEVARRRFLFDAQVPALRRLYGIEDAP
jgi:glycosyltransferase involved in cell wall biosynthesis